MRLFERRVIPSVQNGEIIFRRLLHRIKVTVQGHDQSSHYIADMWRDALTHLPTGVKVENVLLLGLGAGNAVAVLRDRFPQTQITAVEWDGEMVELAREQGVENVEIVHDDAIKAVQYLSGPFDLILIDLFKGGIPEMRLGETETQQALKRLLHSDGHLILNVFTTDTLLVAFDKTFVSESTWTFQYNRLALFRR